MTSLDYKQSQGDHTHFFKHAAVREVMILLVYVDNISVIGDDKREQQKLQRRM